MNNKTLKMPKVSNYFKYLSFFMNICIYIYIHEDSKKIHITVIIMQVFDLTLMLIKANSISIFLRNFN